MVGKLVAAALVAAVAIGTTLLAVGTIAIPERWNPFAPLHVDDEPNVLTRFKLDRLSARPDACRAVLAGSTFRFTPVADRDPGNGCGWHDAVRIDATSAAIGDAFTLTCESAVALALFERHVVQPAALARFGQPVVRIRHYGSFACRNVNGRADAGRSEHATANALDIAAFVLRDGRDIVVRRDWRGNDDKAQFLRELHSGACRFFDVVLGPDYNAAHADHLHIDRGRYRACR